MALIERDSLCAIPIRLLPGIRFLLGRHRALNPLDKHRNETRPVEIVLNVHPHGTFRTRPDFGAADGRPVADAVIDVDVDVK